jgi:hypothetical protein
MKSTKWTKFGLGVLSLAVLAACGKSEDDNNRRYWNGDFPGGGGEYDVVSRCGSAPGVYEMEVVAVINTQAFLRMALFRQGPQQYGGGGQAYAATAGLEVRSLQALGILTGFPGYGGYNNGYNGGYNNGYNGGYNNGYNGSDSFFTCIQGQGYIENASGAFRDLTMSLSGSNASLQLSNGAYITGGTVAGFGMLSINGQSINATLTSP